LVIETALLEMGSVPNKSEAVLKAESGAALAAKA
jgi:hypothetical protein